MQDTGAHPGVRSLLARFENNNNSSNQNTTSPPSRGRSPVGSEHSGSRPLSKVRASFIAVDGATQSGAIAGLRSASSRSDSPAAPPSRVRSFNSDDLNAPLKSPLSSPISNGLDSEQTPNETRSGDMVETVITQVASPEKGVRPQAKEAASPHKRSDPISTVSAAPSPKKTQTVTKRPSTIQVDKVSPNRSASKSTSTTLKSAAHPRTPTSPAKPDHAKASKPARSPRPPATRDAPKAPVTKTSRSSLNTTAKTATRPVRSSMPAREATKPTATSASRTNKPEPRPPTKSARLPTSATTSNLSSAARGGATGTTTSSLSRKPSSLKNATGGIHRTTTASSVRKQASQPSLPRQPAHDRPHSRVSNTSSRAVDEGFLARMMRPTASSANKTHEKVEMKSPPRPSRVTRAPVRPVASKTEAHNSRPMKEKSVAKKPQEKPQPVPTQKEEPQPKAVDPQEDSARVNATEHHAKAADEPVQAVIDASAEAIEKEPTTEKQSEDLPIEPSMASENAPVGPSDPEQPTKAAEASEEQTLAAPSTEELSISADEAADAHGVEPSGLSNTEETKEQVDVESPATSAEEMLVEDVAKSEVKVDDVDVDLGNLSLN
ncbi:putative mucin-7 precursor [Aspergillus nomiae NRRL 13137]|uniref:Putative mucin-7 n=1 Tax=Aspergillus nomiae NRRL (strain ATCC 15546 / NRRL 13137 / CBS 260.88 / M93) TaxID=1509407 RepID=A0A0L1J6U6_ASPN3|nr:putative mucin-7 precursor [Aspergillus nomiae NRRL 13137]KNG87143.1 putative mucin-7 precursor [Aspergillus nomiae NRRL 13137]